MKTLYKIEILNWDDYNKNHKKSMRSVMVSKRFFDDFKIQALPSSGKLLYLFLLLRRGDHDTNLFVCSHDDCVTSAGGRGVVVTRLLDQLQSFQLLRYEKTSSNIIEYNRIEVVVDKKTENNNNLIIDQKVIKPDIAQSSSVDKFHAQFVNKDWFKVLVDWKLDMPVFKANVPLIKDRFKTIENFTAWLQSVVELPKYQELKYQRNVVACDKYITAALRSEMGIK